MKNKLQTCIKCGKEYPLLSKYFCLKSNSSSGFRSDCKQCYNERLRNYYKEHKKAILKTNRDWRENNRDKNKIIQRNYRKKHKNEAREYGKKYRHDHREDVNIRNRIYQHSEKRKQYLKKYNEINKEKILLQNRKRAQNRRKTDIQFRMRSNLSRRLNHALKEQNIQKSNHTMALIGCSIKEFTKFLESKFSPKMSWNNYGRGNNKWNIDHVIPCAFFDLTNIEQQKKCFHFSNMQPLWETDNSIKNSRYEEKIIRKRSKSWQH